MKNYEKPIAKIVDFYVEAVMNAGAGGDFSPPVEGDEDI